MSTNNNVLSIQKLAFEERPREKLQQHGQETLSSAELIAILLGSGTRRLSAIQLAQQILNNCNNNLHELSKMNLQELQKFDGIGAAKAISLIAAFELGKRKTQSDRPKRPKITCSRDAYDILSAGMQDLRKEVFIILLLNRNNRVVKKVQISTGGIAGTVVDPKLIYKAALDYEASSIILSHNHPSGNLKPSNADISITKKLKASGALLDIAVLDHLIISEKGYFSFLDEAII